MERLTPFPDNRVSINDRLPDPLVFYLEEIEQKDGSTIEHVNCLPTSEYLKKFPYEEGEFSVKDLLVAGVPLKECNPRLLGSRDITDYNVSQQDIFDQMSQAMGNNE